MYSDIDDKYGSDERDNDGVKNDVWCSDGHYLPVLTNGKL